MKLTKELKENIIKDLNIKIKKTDFIILTDFTGFKVDKMTQFRRQLDKHKAQLQVTKNTLLRLACQDTALGGFIHYFTDTGPTALVFSFGNDPLSLVQEIVKYSNTNPELRLKGGIFKDRYINYEEILKLASLPSKEVLLSKFFFILRAPQTNFVLVLSGLARSFIHILKEIVATKEKDNRSA